MGIERLCAATDIFSHFPDWPRAISWARGHGSLTSQCKNYGALELWKVSLNRMVPPSDPKMAKNVEPLVINATAPALRSIRSELAEEYNFYLFTWHRSDPGKLIQNDDAEEFMK